jgi:subtilisin-like proprotein convertase family protein
MHQSLWSRWLARAVRSALVTAVLITGLGPGSAGTASAPGDVHAEEILAFSNAAPVPINEGGPSTTSTIDVSGFETDLADVNVTLHNLSHAPADDLDILLVGPEGQTAIILSDIGFNNAATNVTLTLDDQALNQVSSSTAPTSGTFQPTNFQSGDSWTSPPAPVTTPPTGSELGVFNSTDPNGTWRLVIQDDNLNGANGSLAGGWSLNITSANGVPNADPDSFQARAGRQLSSPSGVLANDDDPDGDSLEAILAGQPKKGTVVLQADGSFTYKAKKTAKGSDSFTYLAQDPGGLSDLETVSIQIKKAKKKGK